MHSDGRGMVGLPSEGMTLRQRHPSTHARCTVTHRFLRNLKNSESGLITIADLSPKLFL